MATRRAQSPILPTRVTSPLIDHLQQQRNRGPVFPVSHARVPSPTICGPVVRTGLLGVVLISRVLPHRNCLSDRLARRPPPVSVYANQVRSGRPIINPRRTPPRRRVYRETLSFVPLSHSTNRPLLPGIRPASQTKG